MATHILGASPRMKSTRSPVPTVPAIDENRAMKLIMELLALPGLSGHEDQIAAVITRKLRAAGIPASSIRTDDAHKKSPLGGVHGNLICILPGTLDAPRRMLMAHLDTVPLCAGAKPVRKDGYVKSGNPTSGLGADNRSGVAATLNAVLEILRRKLPHPPLTLLWPVQEEVGLYGARNVNAALLKNPKLCFNWDGGAANRVIIGATGAYRMQITVTGLASHAGVHPEHGISATAIAALAIADLHTKGWHGLIVKNGKRGTSNIGVISGGNATNVVTAEVTLRVEARSHDAIFRKKIVAAIRTAFERAVKRVKNDSGKRGKVRIDAELHYESFKLRANDPSAAVAARAIAAAGLKPEVCIANGGLDANWLSARGLPTVSLGAGQHDVHTVNERLIIPSFLDGCRIALAIATGYQ
jgi:tripeptide aminopeptidase